MGLLDRFNRGMNAVQTGLLGNPQVNPALAPYLSPGVMDSANKDARMQMGLAMLAASESGMGFGQGMMMARAAGQQAYQNPIEGDLRANMTADALRRATEQRDEQAKMAQMVATVKAQRPDLANLPDNEIFDLIVKEKDPSLTQRKEEFNYQRFWDQKTADREDKRWGANYALDLKQLAQSAMQQDREFGLGVARFALDQERLNAELGKLKLPKVDEVETRKRRESALAGANMSALLNKLKTDISENGTETFGPGAGRQGAIYGQILSEFKQAKQMGTLDRGLLELFDKMLKDPTTILNSAGSMTGAIPAQIETLLDETKRQYQTDYDYLSEFGLQSGLPDLQQSVAPALDFSAIQKELKRRGLSH